MIHKFKISRFFGHPLMIVAALYLIIKGGKNVGECPFLLFLTPCIKSEFKMPVRNVAVAMCGLPMGFGNCLTRSGNFT